MDTSKKIDVNDVLGKMDDINSELKNDLGELVDDLADLDISDETEENVTMTNIDDTMVVEKNTDNTNNAAKMDEIEIKATDALSVASDTLNTLSSANTNTNWLPEQLPNAVAAQKRSIELRKVKAHLLRMIQDSDIANLTSSVTNEYNVLFNTLTSLISLENIVAEMGDVLRD